MGSQIYDTNKTPEINIEKTIQRQAQLLNFSRVSSLLAPLNLAG